MMCNVNGCFEQAMGSTSRCRLHRDRGFCSIDGCVNKVYARRLCCRHGAKRQCCVDGCNLRARLDNVCYKHGANKKLCSEPGCKQSAQARQKCVKHGGGRRCKTERCVAHARSNGFCQRHRPISPKNTFVNNIHEGDCYFSYTRTYSLDSEDDVSSLGSWVEPTINWMVESMEFGGQATDDGCTMENVLELLVEL